jgi:hypothetical protein
LLTSTLEKRVGRYFQQDKVLAQENIGKVFPVLTYAPCYEDRWERGGIVPHIVNPGIKWI